MVRPTGLAKITLASMPLPSYRGSIGKFSAKPTASTRRWPGVSDNAISENKSNQRLRAAHCEIHESHRERGLFGYDGTFKETLDRVWQFKKNLHLSRVFSESLRRTLEKDTRINRLEWARSVEITKITSPLFRSWGTGYGWYNVRKIVLPFPNPEISSHYFYPDLEGEGFGTWKPSQEIADSFEVKLTRDMYRAFARLQESEGFVPGLIDTKEVLYKEDFKALLQCLGA